MAEHTEIAKKRVFLFDPEYISANSTNRRMSPVFVTKISESRALEGDSIIPVEDEDDFDGAQVCDAERGMGQLVHMLDHQMMQMSLRSIEEYRAMNVDMRKVNPQDVALNFDPSMIPFVLQLATSLRTFERAISLVISGRVIDGEPISDMMDTGSNISQLIRKVKTIHKVCKPHMSAKSLDALTGFVKRMKQRLNDSYDQVILPSIEALDS